MSTFHKYALKSKELIFYRISDSDSEGRSIFCEVIISLIVKINLI